MTDPRAKPNALDARAAEVCRRLSLGPDARKLLQPQHTVRAYVGLLLEQGLFPETAVVLASALPRREAVWWACLCIRTTQTEVELEDVVTALVAAEHWVRDQSEASRRAAGRAAEEQGWETPAALAAAGAFWSGGSLAPPEVSPPIPPADDLTAKGVGGAVSLLALTGEAERIPAMFRLYARLAEEVATGQRRWGSETRKEGADAARSPRR